MWSLGHAEVHGLSLPPSKTGVPEANESPLGGVETELDKAVLNIHEGAKVTWLYQMTDGLDSVQLELRFQLEGVECPAVGAKTEPSVCFVHREHATLEVVWRQTEVVSRQPISTQAGVVSRPLFRGQHRHRLGSRPRTRRDRRPLPLRVGDENGLVSIVVGSSLDSPDGLQSGNLLKHGRPLRLVQAQGRRVCDESWTVGKLVKDAVIRHAGGDGVRSKSGHLVRVGLKSRCDWSSPVLLRCRLQKN